MKRVMVSILVSIMLLISIPAMGDDLKYSPGFGFPDIHSTDFSWKRIGSGNIIEIDITIINNSKYQIKDVEIICTHYAKSGACVDSSRYIIYDIVPPKNRKIFRELNMGVIHSQAYTTLCKINSFK